jgi:hypothetical protein
MAALTKDDLADLPTRACRYERHRPESTLLYQIVQKYWPRFQAHLAHHGKQVPAYVIQEFEAYIACGRLDRGFSSRSMRGVPRRAACGVQLSQRVTRPAISEQRLSTAANGNVIYALKTPYSDGTTETPSHMWCSARWNSLADWRYWSRNRGSI